jgi:hypothetical protein
MSKVISSFQLFQLKLMFETWWRRAALDGSPNPRPDLPSRSSPPAAIRGVIEQSPSDMATVAVFPRFGVRDAAAASAPLVSAGSEAGGGGEGLAFGGGRRWWRRRDGAGGSDLGSDGHVQIGSSGFSMVPPMSLDPLGFPQREGAWASILGRVVVAASSVGGGRPTFVANYRISRSVFWSSMARRGCR